MNAGRKVSSDAEKRLKKAIASMPAEWHEKLATEWMGAKERARRLDSAFKVSAATLNQRVNI